MTATPGYEASVSMSGTPTTMTGEAMSLSTTSTDSNTYKVSAESKRCFSSTGTIYFYENGSTTAISNDNIEKINYLFGEVTLSTALTGSTTFSTPITVTGKYIPLSEIIGAHQYTLTQSATLLDNTDFSSTGWASKIPGLKTVSLSLSKFEDDSNSSSTESTIYDYFKSGTKVIIELKPNTSGLKSRGWFIVENENRSGGINDISDRSVSFQLSPNLGYGKGFGWGY